MSGNFPHSHDPDFIDDVFGPGGVLARAKPGYVMREGQVKLARAAAGAFEAGKAVLAEAPTGCHVAGQLLLLHDGRRVKVEDVRVGDLLMGPDSQPRRVLALARGEQETVTIVPVKGEPWRVNLDHILTLKRTGVPVRVRRRDCRVGQLVDVRVRDWLGWSRTQKHLHKLVRADRVCFGPHDDLEQQVNIDPYFLGVLLGDGGFTQTSVVVTTISPEIEQATRLAAESYGLEVRETVLRGCKHLRLSGKLGNKNHPIMRELRELGLMGKGSGTKFVPQVYLSSDAIDRAALLAGLIDTDGSLSCGGFEYGSKSQALAQDAAFLARSLGLAAYVKRCRKTCTNNGKTGTYYRVFISGDIEMVPVRLPHKRPAGRAQKKSPLVTGFKVVPTGRVERYYGFTLDCDGRYLLEDFTITHNTGKSFAYLVPATWAAAHRDRKVIIVTANIALQEQLVEKDLPFLAEHLPWKFSFALAKGWSNYLCREWLNDARNEQLKGRRLPVLQEQKQLEEVFAWSDHTDEGDISELPFELGALRSKVTISKDDCLGKACDFFDDCFPRKARAQLDSAQVLVANYHLFFADLALKRMGLAGILPDARIVVLDEGHKAADIAREFFGQRVTPFSVSRAVSLLDAKGKRAEKLSIPERIDSDLRQLVIDQADELFAALAKLKADERRYKARLDREDMFDPSELVSSMKSASAQLNRAMGCGGVSPEGRLHLEQAASRCLVVASTLERAASVADDEDWIYYLDSIGDRRVALMAVPFSVKDILRPVLFEREHDPVGVVVTSATLTTSSGDSAFDYIASQLGAESASELIVESPFDFTKSCLIVPRVCPPNEKAFAAEVAEQLVEAVRLTGGRTLALFTSYRVLQVCYERLMFEIESGGLPVSMGLAKQGEAPRTQLLQRFREDETSVLLGCESFWEGVDVPGPSLSCVFMDRIPFDHARDPVLDAVQARDSKAFARYQLPRATIMFRQGFGRLVRSVSDSGMVVCCDSRLVDKGYGKAMLRALPKGVTAFRRLELGAKFLPDFE